MFSQNVRSSCPLGDYSLLLQTHTNITLCSHGLSARHVLSVSIPYFYRRTQIQHVVCFTHWCILSDEWKDACKRNKLMSRSNLVIMNAVQWVKEKSGRWRRTMSAKCCPWKECFAYSFNSIAVMRLDDALVTFSVTLNDRDFKDTLVQTVLTSTFFNCCGNR